MILSFHRNLRDTDIVSLQYRGITIIPRNRPALLLKTAVADVRAGPHCCSANILLDEGAQQSFISQKLADQLQTSTSESVTMSISAFGGTSTPSTLQSTSVQLVTRTGDEVTLSVLVVLTIATPLKISNLVYQAVEQLPYLHGLDMAHPITYSPDFEISVLFGADFYWQIVED